MGYSAGLSAEVGPIATKLLYTHLNVDNVLPGASANSQGNSLQIPVLFTMGFAGTYVGLGGFYGSSLETGGGSNYGASAGVKVSLPMTGLSVEGLINLGLKDQGAGEKTSVAALLLGFSFL